jgi:hypothetical protein
MVVVNERYDGRTDGVTYIVREVDENGDDPVREVNENESRRCG